MHIQKCDKCNTQFKWGTVYKSLMCGYKPILCNECGTNHKIIFTSRIKVSLLSIVPLIILGYLMLSFHFFSPIILLIIIMVVFAVLLTLLDPFVAKYNSDF